MSLFGGLRPDTRDLSLGLSVRLDKDILGCSVSTFWTNNIVLLAVPRYGKSADETSRFYDLSWFGLMVQVGRFRSEP